MRPCGRRNDLDILAEQPGDYQQIESESRPRTKMINVVDLLVDGGYTIR
jgi:hypothetical protein